MTDWYTASGNPTQGSAGTSNVLRSEYNSIATAFSKMPALTGYGGLLIGVNSSGTALQTYSYSEVLSALNAAALNTNVSFLTINGTTITASTQFSGPGTGLTGTASGLSIGGNAATATNATNATNATYAASATTSTNLAAGSAGTLPYQSASGTTAMLAAGSSGNVLLSGGAGAPSWSTTTGTGSVVKADSPTFTGTGNTATWNMTTPQYSGVAMSRMVQGTAVATTSGTAIDFTGIPSWAKRITVMFNGVSVQASQPRVQLGSGSVATTGYSGAAGTAASNSAFSNGFDVPSTFANSGNNFNGHMVFTLLGSNTWVCGIAMGSSGVSNLYISGGGAVTLSGALDRIRLTTVNGTDAFDAGSVNILYEG